MLREKKTEELVIICVHVIIADCNQKRTVYCWFRVGDVKIKEMMTDNSSQGKGKVKVKKKVEREKVLNDGI